MLVALITLAFIHFCALITPGPDFFSGITDRSEPIS